MKVQEQNTQAWEIYINNLMIEVAVFYWDCHSHGALEFQAVLGMEEIQSLIFATIERKSKTKQSVEKKWKFYVPQLFTFESKRFCTIS